MDSGQLTMKYVCFTLLLLTLSCASCRRNIKFDRKEWESLDLNYSPSNRNRMLKDLTQHYQLVGLHYPQLIQLLGEPEFTDSFNKVNYSIDMGWVDDNTGIDAPNYEKDLSFYLSKDSVVTSFKVHESR